MNITSGKQVHDESGIDIELECNDLFLIDENTINNEWVEGIGLEKNIELKELRELTIYEKMNALKSMANTLYDYVDMSEKRINELEKALEAAEKKLQYVYGLIGML